VTGVNTCALPISKIPKKKKKLVSFLNILKNSKVGPKVRNHPEKALNFLFVMGKNYKS
jgi:hypothetical protein